MRFYACLTYLLFLIGHVYGDWQLPPHQFPATGGGVDMAFDEKGNALAVLDDGGTLVSFFYSRDMDTWLSTKPPLATVNSSPNIRVVMNAYDNAMAIWTDQKGELNSSLFNGNEWTHPIPFATPSEVRSLVLVMNGQDAALACWIDNSLNAVFSSFFKKGTWSEPLQIANSNGEQLSAAYSPSGTAVVGFVNESDGQVINYKDGVWQSPVRLEPSPHLCAHNIVVGIDAEGKALVMWMPAIPWDIVVRRYDGSVWQAPVTISGDYHSNLCFGTSLGMTPDGRAVAVWLGDDLNGYPYRIFSSTFDGTSWDTPQKILDQAIYASMTVNSHGDALLLFCISLQIKSAQLPFKGTWTIPVVLSNTNVESSDAESMEYFYLTMVPFIGNDGFVLAGWGIGIDNQMKYFASPDTTPISPPTSIEGSVSKKKKKIVHTITWMASSSPHVQAYHVKKNGKLVAVIPADGPLVFSDYGRSKKHADTYTVTAVDQSGRESELVMLTLR
jgi:hypothetical protein